MITYTNKFTEIGITELAQVGGKNSSLWEMFSKLSSKGILVTDGFDTTAYAFEEFLKKHSLYQRLADLMRQLERPGYRNLKEMG